MTATQSPLAPTGRPPMGGCGLSTDRMALAAARQAFMQLKLSYLQVIDTASGSGHEALRERLCCAEEPVELWRLRGAVFNALPAQGANATRAALKRHFDQTFPLSDLPSVFRSP